jgi:Skp family chaperone for outer membrane proteins
VRKGVPIVKKFYLSAVVVAALVTVYVAADAQAQRGPASGPMPTVGIVDISYIFKNHARFQQQMESMKQDAETTKNQIMKEKERIQKVMEQLKDYKQGTAEYNKLEEDITHMQADFNAKAALQQKDFLERESRVYIAVYKEVADAVNLVSRQRGMTLVLRFNGDPVEPGNRESVLREINKPIVHYTREADITPDVISEVNRGGGAAPARSAARPGGVGVPVQPR